MEDRERKGAIRLTNKTAIALRRTAKKTRRTLTVTAVILTILLFTAAVLLGMWRFYAVPVCVLAAIGLDVLLLGHARRVYLRMVGEAICTEAAARVIKEEKTEASRRRQAVSDVMDMKRDLLKAMEGEGPVPDDEDEDLFAVTNTRPKIAPRPQDRAPQTTLMGTTAAKAQPARRRRRRPPLTVLKNEQAK